MLNRPMGLSGKTQVVGIIGDPVAHSLSPSMHNAAFRALGLDFVYVAFRVSDRRLPAALDGVRGLGIAGVNVTVPHKERVLELVDSVSSSARRVGAVNTVVNRGGMLHGENTDVIGFLRALRGARVSVRSARVLLVGAGGVARAVLAALAAGGARAATVANRTGGRARSLARAFDTSAMPTRAVPVAGLQDSTLLAAVDVVVNATSIGLRGEAFLPLRVEATPPHCVFVDVIYGRPTAFLAGAARAGRRTLDGTAMLVHQGAAAFTLWTRRRAPLAVMWAAIVRGGRLSAAKIDKGRYAQ